MWVEMSNGSLYDIFTGNELTSSVDVVTFVYCLFWVVCSTLVVSVKLGTSATVQMRYIAFLLVYIVPFIGETLLSSRARLGAVAPSNGDASLVFYEVSVVFPP